MAKKNVEFLTEEELARLDKKVLEEYLLKLESIEEGLNQYVEEIKKKANKDGK